MAVVNLGAVDNFTSGFDPRSFGGCALWLDGADSSSVTGSNPISAWRDKSGTGRTVTVMSGSLTYDSANKNVYTNANSYFRVDVDIRKTATTYLNLFMVHKWLSVSNTNQALWGADVGGGWNRLQLLAFPAYTKAAYGLAYGNDLQYTVSGLNTSNQVLYNATMAYGIAGSTGVYLNGTAPSALVTEGNPATFTSATVMYFSALDATNSYRSQVSYYEILVYNIQITSQQRQAIEGYLAWKWGLQANLPATHPFRNIQPVGVVYDPLNVPNCNLWIDAYDPSTITLSGSTITAVQDKSGYGNNSTSVASTITYVSSGINGRPAFYFPGTIDGTGYQRIYGPITAAPATVTVFIVCTIDSQALTYRRMFSATPVAQAEDFNNASSFTMTQDQTNAAVSTTKNSVTSGALAITITTPFIWYLTTTSTGMSQLVNGAGTSSANVTGTLAYDRYAIGDTAAAVGSNSKGPMIGYVGEVLVYNRTLTVAERRQVEGYLANKWGLRASLPATQPFNSYLLPRSSLFLPNQLTSTLSVWWDGRDPNNIVATIPANGDVVTTWTDKCRTVANNGTGVNSPTYSLSLRAVQFVAASSQYYTTSFTASAASETIFVVAQTTGSGTYTLVGASNTNGRVLRVNATNYIELLGGTGGTYTSSSTISPGSTFLLACSYNASASGVVMRINGTAQTISNTTAVALTSSLTTILGADASGTNPLNGYIMEVFSYSSSVLVVTDIQRVEGYLAWKWNLNGLLPSTHPYYKIKP